MPTQPTQPPRPPTTPQQQPKPSQPTPQQHQQPKPPAPAAAAHPKPDDPQTAKPSYTREEARDEPLIGAKPKDARDPQAAKFEAHAGPPHWQDPAKSQAKAPPPDGMSSADEQRERAAEVEAHGFKSLDQRPDEQKPTFDPHALAGGGAFVKAGERKQVPGVTPPTKRE